jgi:hypothetical protein
MIDCLLWVVPMAVIWLIGAVFVARWMWRQDADLIKNQSESERLFSAASYMFVSLLASPIVTPIALICLAFYYLFALPAYKMVQNGK